MSVDGANVSAGPLPREPDTMPAFAFTMTAGGDTCGGRLFGSMFWASVPLKDVWTPAAESVTEPSKCGAPVKFVWFVVAPSRPTGSPCVRATSPENDQPKAASGRGGGRAVRNDQAAEDEDPPATYSTEATWSPPARFATV